MERLLLWVCDDLCQVKYSDAVQPLLVRTGSARRVFFVFGDRASQATACARFLCLVLLFQNAYEEAASAVKIERARSDKVTTN